MCLKKSCSTKKLYILELGILKKEYNECGKWFYIQSLEPPVYIVGKEISGGYKNILTNEKFNNLRKIHYIDTDVVVKSAKRVITTQKRFIYKDAEKLIESGNCYYKMK